jgi:isopenicillin N synthase-like dioxygenase
MMQYLTNNYLTATPHKVALNTQERFAFAYFHEPSFQAVLRPLGSSNKELHDISSDGIHYGTHFTNMCVRNYPHRITTQRLLAEDRCNMLSENELRTMGVPQQ